jgi:hypothetical protein
MNCNAEESGSRISEGEFRHYVFGVPELHAEVQRFLSQVGYESKSNPFIGLVQPDFRAKRRTDNSTYELVGMIRDSLDQGIEALVKLAAIKAAKHDLDCVLVLPPINEYLLIEFLTEEKGRWYFGMKDARLMVWFCNPDNHTTICVIGAPSDRDFQKHFYLSQMSFDDYMSIRASHLIQERLLAEEEEED